MNKVIKVKTDCPHFSTVGNLCSRVENGMVRCDEYSECEFKYIDALKEETTELKEKLDEANQLKDMYHTYYRAKHDDIKGIIFKQKEKLERIKEIAETALKANYCNNCDGIGIPECADYECHTYALDKIMDIIEGAEE